MTIRNSWTPSTIFSGQSAKLEVGKRYIQVWAPDNGRVPFPSIITVWGGGTLRAINWRWGTAFSCFPLHFNHWPSGQCLRSPRMSRNHHSQPRIVAEVDVISSRCQYCWRRSAETVVDTTWFAIARGLMRTSYCRTLESTVTLLGNHVMSWRRVDQYRMDVADTPKRLSVFALR